MTSFDNYQLWLNSGVLTDKETEELKAIQHDADAIEDRFGSALNFGTAGLRGIMAMGSNRMNSYVVRRATQGLANYLLQQSSKPTTVISYDSRLNSRNFAEATARVLAANGITTYLFSEMMPVPVLSFAVRHLNCDAGIMITASHNPKEYNGYKVYNGTGGQILDAEADAILQEIQQVGFFDGIKDCTLKEALEGTCSYVDPSVYETYLQTMDDASAFSDERDLNIVYTPLNGSGRKPVQDILSKNGFKVSTVAAQEQEDPEFATCPSPNPEKAEVYALALADAKAMDADLIVATDPDCDRVGAMVKQGDDYVLLTGNEIGTLMLQYICECSETLEGKYICTSMVSTLMVDAIAAAHGLEVKRTHVGFKYIGEQMEANPADFLFGFEESNGYLVGDYARDKDGVVAAKILCQMAAYYRAKGKTLVDVLEDLYQQHGYVIEKTITISVENQAESQRIMKSLRDADAVRAAFPAMASMTDYADESIDTGLPKANVLKMTFADGARLIVRPSGTEPKVKLYVSSCGSGKEACMQNIDVLIHKLNEVIGVE